MSKIDIIMPTYNQPEFLDRAISSILAQEFKDFSFIIVDDGNSQEIRKEIEKYQGVDSRISIVRHDTNKGLPAALNSGHRYGSSPYCSWISTDNVSYPRQYKALYECITTGEYDFVQSRWNVNKNNNIRTKDIRRCKHNWGFANLCPSFLYKRIVWETYPYDENMLCVEDLKFYLQAFLHPFKFGYVEECLMEYYVQSNSLTSHGNPNRRHEDMLTEVYETVVKPKLLQKG